MSEASERLAEASAMRRDAERYRELRRRAVVVGDQVTIDVPHKPHGFTVDETTKFDALDRTVDFAILRRQDEPSYPTAAGY